MHSSTLRKPTALPMDAYDNRESNAEALRFERLVELNLPSLILQVCYKS